MEGLLRLLCAILFVHPFGAAASESLLGVHPLDEKYHLESELIDCKDKSSSFTRDRLNDDFCDCVDGSDEPGTSACPEGRFYCKNVGSTPQFLFSSRVNDHICDCCDGSDEYDGSIYCPSTCIMGGNIEYKSQTHHYKRLNSLHGDAVSAKGNKPGTRLEDLIDNVKGLKTVALAQLVLLGTGATAIFVVLCVFCRCCQRTKLRRRRHR